jgi:hypothetical protein
LVREIIEALEKPLLPDRFGIEVAAKLDEQTLQIRVALSHIKQDDLARSDLRKSSTGSRSFSLSKFCEQQCRKSGFMLQPASNSPGATIHIPKSMLRAE